ncbi:uncharacterized protein LOC132888838 [Neoarius graeffei]|uniref:uncharacterized protein LOC132888838 n=1 Tax=Neoarius graeffei TaxID=443677 RepID=UPI00298D477A|nr:uncharacterized protein LOC132888838 [Neoarius graeffei]
MDLKPYRELRPSARYSRDALLALRHKSPSLLPLPFLSDIPVELRRPTRRKRGRRGGIRNRLRRRYTKPPLPVIILSNVRSLNNKIDDLRTHARYNLVIFGGIGGYSRKIMYLNAASNNTASTGLEFFLDGVRRFGWPYKVRGDQGVENVSIAQMRFTVRGTGHGSFISGKSVHNQSLEEDGALDISDHLHLFCAQDTFLPRFKADLAKFSTAWNNHPLRTEGFLSPNQLWELGMMQHPIRQPEMHEENEGIIIEDIDWENIGLCHDSSTNPGVTVPEMECPLTTEDLAMLCLSIDPLSHSNSFGRDIYLTTLTHALYLLRNHSQQKYN